MNLDVVTKILFTIFILAMIYLVVKILGRLSKIERAIYQEAPDKYASRGCTIPMTNDLHSPSNRTISLEGRVVEMRHLLSTITEFLSRPPVPPPPLYMPATHAPNPLTSLAREPIGERLDVYAEREV